MKVSICVPIFNGEKYLKECLDSILAQTFKDFELIISDDKSTDSSLEIVKNFISTNYWIQSKVLINNNRGIGSNWNNCLRSASGEYIKFLFQDDVLEFDCLDKMTSVLDSNSNVGLVGCRRNIVVNSSNYTFIEEWITKFSDLQSHLDKNSDGNFLIDRNFFKSEFFFHNPLNKIGEPSTVMFRRSIVSEIGYFSLELIQTLDFEYWFRILKKHKILILNECLVNFRLHNDQATFVNKFKYRFEYLKLYEILRSNFFWLFSWSNKIEILLRLYPQFIRYFQFYKILKKKLFINR